MVASDSSPRSIFRTPRSVSKRSTLNRSFIAESSKKLITPSRIISTPHGTKSKIKLEDLITSTAGKPSDVSSKRSIVDNTFYNTGLLKVSLFSSLPINELERIGNQAHYTVLDIPSKCAAYVTNSVCYLWSIFQRSNHNVRPITVTIPLEIFNENSTEIPIVCFTHSQHSSDTGFLISFTNGNIYYYSSVVLGAFNSTSYARCMVNLTDREYIEGIEEVEGIGMIISTSTGGLYRLNLTTVNGMVSGTVVGLRKSSGILYGVTSLLSSYSSPTKAKKTYRGNIATLVLFAESTPADDGNSKIMHIYRKGILEKWYIAKNQKEKDIGEYKIQKMVQEKISELSPTLSNCYCAILDIALTNQNEYVALIGYSENEKSDIANYALAIIFINDENNVDFSFFKSFNYSTPIQTLMNPQVFFKLTLPNNCYEGFATFPDCIISFDLDSEYEDTIKLKDSSNWFIDFCAERNIMKSSNLAHGFALCKNSQILFLELNCEKSKSVESLNQTDYDKKTEIFQKKLEQAVMFQAIYENPLDLKIRNFFIDSTDAAVLNVSFKILNSELPTIPLSIDIEKSFIERLQHHAKLIDLIAFPEILQKISSQTKVQLCNNAEILSSCYSLFQYITSSIRKEKIPTNAPWLIKMLKSFSKNDLEDENFFFKIFQSKTTDEFLCQVLNELLDFIKNEEHSNLLIMYNDIGFIFKAVVGTGLIKRKKYSSLLSLEMPDECKWWTVNEQLIKATENFCFIIAKFLRDHIQGDLKDHSLSESVNKQYFEELTVVFCEVCSCLFQMYKARIENYKSIQHTERESSAKHFRKCRQTLILSMKNIGKGSIAFKEAEFYGDFAILIEMAFDSDDPEAVFHMYLDQFGMDFAVVLYDSFVEKGMWYDLLDCSVRHKPLLEEYFEQHPHPEVSWINNIILGKYNQVSSSLLTLSASEDNLIRKEMMLSISKLANLAEGQYLNDEIPRDEQLAIDDEFLILSSQKRIVAHFESQVEDFGKKDLEGQVLLVRNVFITPLFNKKPFIKIFDHYTRELLKFKVLPFEDLVDYLTMLELGEEEVPVVIDLCASYGSARNLSLVENTVSVMWGRTYIATDWDELESRWKDMDKEKVDQDLGLTLVHRYLAAWDYKQGNARLIILPENISLEMDEEEAQQRYGHILSPPDLKMLIKESQEFQHLLEKYATKHHLGSLIQRSAKLIGLRN